MSPTPVLSPTSQKCIETQGSLAGGADFLDTDPANGPTTSIPGTPGGVDPSASGGQSTNDTMSVTPPLAPNQQQGEMKWQTAQSRSSGT